MIIKGNCSKCGEYIEFDESMKRVLCLKCGTPFIPEQFTQKTANSKTAEELIGQYGASAEVLLSRAKKQADIDNYDGVKEYVKKVLEIDANNAEARSLLNNNKPVKIGLSEWKYAYILKKHVDEIDSAVKNKDLGTADALFNKYMLTKDYTTKSMINKILKEWRKSGIDSVIL